jgi:hypothetical protein
MLVGKQACQILRQEVKIKRAGGNTHMMCTSWPQIMINVLPAYLTVLSNI